MSRLQWPLALAVILFSVWKYLEVSRLYKGCVQRKEFDKDKNGCENIQTGISRKMLEIVEEKSREQERQKERGLQRQYCVDEEMRWCAAPLYDYKKRYRTARKYRASACVIEKNYSTMLTAIFCFLHNEERFRKSNRTMSREVYHKRFCAGMNEHTYLDSIGRKYNLTQADDWKTWNLLAVVRDPLERFISGFTDKCLREKTWIKHPTRCNKCKTNLTCFINQQYSRIMRRAAGAHQPANFDDDHFFPQNWRCQFSSHFHQYKILRFDSANPYPFYKELLSHLRKANVSENNLEFISSEMEANRTRHSTVSSEERASVLQELRGSPALVEKLIKMYYFDFVLFGYPIPSVPFPLP